SAVEPRPPTTGSSPPGSASRPANWHSRGGPGSWWRCEETGSNRCLSTWSRLLPELSIWSATRKRPGSSPERSGHRHRPIGRWEAVFACGSVSHQMGGGCRTVPHSQLREEVRDVVLDGLLGQEQLLGDLPVRLAFGDQLEDRYLPRCEVSQAVRFGVHIRHVVERLTASDHAVDLLDQLQVAGSLEDESVGSVRLRVSE